MDFFEGYKEVRRLLEKEYGDFFKVLMVYVNKVFGWFLVWLDDVLGLKCLLFFLIKCKNVMMSVFYMNELNYFMNLQIIVKKFFLYFQLRWCDCVVKLKENGRIVSFKDFVDFVVLVVELVNDFVFGVQVLSSIQERCRDNSGRDGKKKFLLVIKISNSFVIGIIIFGIEVVNYVN